MLNIRGGKVIRRDLTEVVVFGEGPEPCACMLVGERPGKWEAVQERPFVGPAGKDMDEYLAGGAIDRADCYVTNLVKRFRDYEKPSPEEIEEWLPVLFAEIDSVQPKVIGLMGTYAVEAVMAAWWPSAVLNVRHGCPWRLPTSQTVVMPMYHPAGGLYDPLKKMDIQYDFEQLGMVVRGEVSGIQYIDTRPVSGSGSIWGWGHDHRESDITPERLREAYLSAEGIE